jgi:hypothetical protein
MAYEIVNNEKSVIFEYAVRHREKSNWMDWGGDWMFGGGGMSGLYRDSDINIAEWIKTEIRGARTGRDFIYMYSIKYIISKLFHSLSILIS